MYLRTWKKFTCDMGKKDYAVDVILTTLNLSRCPSEKAKKHI